MATMKVQALDNPELAAAFRRITGCDPTQVYPEIGLELRRKGEITLRWSSFCQISAEEAEELMTAMQNRADLELR